MSTDFGEVQGIGDRERQGQGLAPAVHVNRFAGPGGPCAQLTLTSEYVQLDRPGVRDLQSRLNALYGRRPLAMVIEEMLWPERFPPGHDRHDAEHVYWQGEHENETAFQWSADTIEWVADVVTRELA